MRHAAVWTDAMDEGFAQPLPRVGGRPFRVEDLCLRVEETPACREVAADLCAPAAAAGYLKNGYV